MAESDGVLPDVLDESAPFLAVDVNMPGKFFHSDVVNSLGEFSFVFSVCFLLELLQLVFHPGL